MTAIQQASSEEVLLEKIKQGKRRIAKCPHCGSFDVEHTKKGMYLVTREVGSLNVSWTSIARNSLFCNCCEYRCRWTARDSVSVDTI